MARPRTTIAQVFPFRPLGMLRGGVTPSTLVLGAVLPGTGRPYTVPPTTPYVGDGIVSVDGFAQVLVVAEDWPDHKTTLEGLSVVLATQEDWPDHKTTLEGFASVIAVQEDWPDHKTTLDGFAAVVVVQEDWTDHKTTLDGLAVVVVVDETYP